MKIVIIAGGTGSIALQTGLYSLLDGKVEGVDIKVIVNAYDNGLSTGLVRKVMGGRILGPSDVRKNQTTRLKLQNPDSPLIKFLDTRFTLRADEVQDFCHQKIGELANSLEYSTTYDTLSSAVNTYFSYSDSVKIDYNDFSLSNIIYAGLAAQHGYSMREAARVMAKILDIPDNVLVNDDTSLYLGARTKSGHEITDEGDIVCWNNPDDPIVDVFFTDHLGQPNRPVLNEECASVIKDADYIILSSGTQWASLIPTYESRGFDTAMQQSKARIFMIMNRAPDKDAPNQSASDIVRQISKYFPSNSLEVILDSSAHELMRELDSSAYSLVKNARTFELSSEDPTKHDSYCLALTFAASVHSEIIDAEAYVFDYDDTLVGRGNSHPLASKYNIDRLMLLSSQKRVFICSGNSIKAIKIASTVTTFDPNTWQSVHNKLTIFADGGINQYEYDPGSSDPDAQPWLFKECIAPEFKFPGEGPSSAKEIIKSLRAVGIPASKIENRGDVVISIKPIDPEYRMAVYSLVRTVIAQYEHLIVRMTGRTTVDISHKSMGKDATVAHIYKSYVRQGKLVYVGDEVEDGNDAPVKLMQLDDLNVVRVKDPADTALMLLALTQGRKYV